MAETSKSSTEATQAEQPVMIRLITKEGTVTEVTEKTILAATAMKEIYNNLGKEAITAEGITLPPISIGQLRNVVKWIEDHDGKPEYDWSVDEITNERNWAKLSEEDKNFLEPLQLADYIELLDAAHFMGVDSLRWAVSQTIAGKIKDKDVDAIREYFNEPDDLTPEEKEAIRKEDIWANF